MARSNTPISLSAIPASRHRSLNRWACFGTVGVLSIAPIGAMAVSLLSPATFASAWPGNLALILFCGLGYLLAFKPAEPLRAWNLSLLVNTLMLICVPLSTAANPGSIEMILAAMSNQDANLSLTGDAVRSGLTSLFGLMALISLVPTAWTAIALRRRAHRPTPAEAG